MVVEVIIYVYLFFWINRLKIWKIDRNVVEVNKCIWKKDEKKIVVILCFLDGKIVEFKLGWYVVLMISVFFVILVLELVMF